MRITEEEPPPPSEEGRSLQPGLVVLVEEGTCGLRVHRMRGPAILGAEGTLKITDRLVSAKHVEIAHKRGKFVVTDLGSRNGVWLDGRRIEAATEVRPGKALRLGGTIVLLETDIERFQGCKSLLDGEHVVGPHTRAAMNETIAAGRAGRDLLILGETGTGKEVIARTFHRSSPHAKGRFVGVNCAAIARDLAEAILFGAKKGSHSTATADQEGVFGRANRGTLFLDELGTLDLALQAKLLRAIEEREIFPLGSATPVPIALHLVAATNADLANEMKANRFRPDLYERIAHRVVRLRPLHQRIEEIPLLVERACKLAAEDGPKPSARLLAWSMSQRWSTNVRGLLNAVERGVARAVERRALEVLPEHMDAGATEAASGGPTSTRYDERRAEIEALVEEVGVPEASRRLKIPRSSLYDAIKIWGAQS